MRSGTSIFLTKARESLGEAKTIAAVGLFKVATRCAYYAAFHAAEALIYERAEKIAKTHTGVRSEFARLLKDDPLLSKHLHAFLVRGYTFKQVSDYGPAEVEPPTSDNVDAAIATAADFVDTIETIVRREAP